MNLKKAVIIVLAILFAVLGMFFFINRNDLHKNLIKQENEQTENINDENTIYEEKSSETEKNSFDKENKTDSEKVTQNKQVKTTKNKNAKKLSKAQDVKTITVKNNENDKTSQNDSENTTNVYNESVYKDNAIEIEQLIKPTKDYRVKFQNKIYLIHLRRPIVEEIPQTTEEKSENNENIINE